MNVDDDDANGPLDPRIEMELENLNNATDDINQLEIELDEARRTFAQLDSDLKNQLFEEQNRAGLTNIMKARAYYEAVAARNEAQIKCRRETELFRKASENLAAAMETESVAMNSFKMHQHKFNDSWQEWLNQVTAKVMEDTNKKIACQREHQKITAHCKEAEKLVKELGEKYRKALIKTKRYYEVKERMDQELPLQREKIRCLEESVQRAKRIYATSLRALEEISNQIHQQRREYDIIANGPREPGVGAELITPEETVKFNEEPSKLLRSRKTSMESSSDAGDKAEAEQDLKDVLELRRSIDNLGGRSVDGSESTSSQWELELQAGLDKLNNSLLMSHIDEQSTSVGTTVESQVDLSNRNKSLTQSSEQNDSLVSSKKSFLSSISSTNYSGWQSLTQSPINSILSKSKVALKKSLSKSLTNSPVNKCTIRSPNDKQETSSIVCENVNQPVTNCDTNVQSIKKDDQKGLELPLLSIFNNTKALKNARDKSCSMVNLSEKQNLKGVIKKTALNNIQAVSVERLADARCKLIADGS